MKIWTHVRADESDYIVLGGLWQYYSRPSGSVFRGPKGYLQFGFDGYVRKYIGNSRTITLKSRSQ